jgi:riboflavin synthase
MFTGIIREIGALRSLRKQPGGGARAFVECRAILPEIAVGDSVAVAGVCTTVVRLEPSGFEADLSVETLTRTTLPRLRAGSPANLEPALRAGDAIGGHYVAGHVDGVGHVTGWTHQGGAVLAEWEAPPEVARFLREKGSIAVDGVSLTPYAVGRGRFSVSLIPETLRETTLGRLRLGDEVNLEADLLAKYAEGTRQETGGVSLELLQRAGFLD